MYISSFRTIFFFRTIYISSFRLCLIWKISPNLLCAQIALLLLLLKILQNSPLHWKFISYRLSINFVKFVFVIIIFTTLWSLSCQSWPFLYVLFEDEDSPHWTNCYISFLVFFFILWIEYLMCDCILMRKIKVSRRSFFQLYV
jgi:hypothetical protein